MELIDPRWRSAWRYLQWADSPFQWRFSKSLCQNCGGRYFLSLKPDAFMTRCLSCTANAVNLSLIPVIKKHSSKSEVVTAWEMSTYGATLNFLKKNFSQVIQSEFFPDKNPGENVNGILNQDVQNLSFESESIDLITSNQVFEHVPNDEQGYAECFRVLKKNGALIFTVPLYDISETKQLAKVIDGKVIHLTEPEYHDSRIAGPKSALTFWHHSQNDISNRVSSAGFNTILVDIFIAPSQKIPQKVVYAVKP